MARIPMTGGFTLIPEGTYVFRIYDAKYDEEFGKVELKLVTAKGVKHTEKISLKNKDDEWNEGALNFFSYFAKTALNDFTRDDVDPEELVDHYILATVTHNEQPNKKDPTKTVTFANLGDLSPAEGFDETPNEKALNMGKETASTPAETTAKKGNLDLDSLLQ